MTASPTMKRLNDLKAELLAYPATRAAYDALAPEFETDPASWWPPAPTLA